MLKPNEKVSPKAIATWFINNIDRDSGEAITHLKVQKLLYYAQAWYLANFDKPLFDEDMKAWTHGPVARSVYDKYKGNGWEALPTERAQSVPAEVVPLLKAVLSKYGRYSAKALEKMTHDDAPWKVTRGDLPLEARCDDPIDKLLMRNFYAVQIGKKKIKHLQS